jgi:hypothetical protein
MGKRGRPPVLTENKRGQIIAIIGVGCSQNVAAQYVGCAVSTVQRTAERDPQFAAQLQHARCNAELSLVKQIRSAAKQEQYWRAAAWALERGFPEKYARRGPDVIDAEQLAQVLSQFAEMIVQQVPVDKYRKNILKGVEALARSLGQTVKQDAAREETAKQQTGEQEAATESKDPSNDPR